MNSTHHLKLITFIIPTYRRPELLKKCIESLNFASTFLGQQDLNEFKFLIRVIVNGESFLELELFNTNTPNESTSLPIEWMHITKRNPSEARNLAIKSVSSDYLYFIDDDTSVPKDFLTRTCEIIRSYPDIEIFGGPDTCENNVSIYEKSLDHALRSPLTTSKTRKRHLPAKNPSPVKGCEKNLILCNLCVKKNIFTKLNIYFPEHYPRNEENVFLNKIPRDVSILYFPQHFIFHKRRSSFKHVYLAASKSGFYRFKMITEDAQWDQLIFLIPLCFLIYLIMIPFGGLNLISITPLLIYFTLNIVTSVYAALEARCFMALVFIPWYQLLIILSYGIGLLKGGLYYLKKYLFSSFKSHLS